MSEKVALPRKVAEAIEELRSQGIADWKILLLSRGALTTESHLVIRRWAFGPRSEGSPSLLMRALVNGYEIKRTPHEELHARYDELLAVYSEEFDDHNKEVINAEIYGITTTLEILGITVEGINDTNTSTDAT